MKKNHWNQIYEPVPQELDQRLENTLSSLRDEEPTTRILPLRTAVIVLALLLALCGIGYALLASRTAETHGWFYGDEKQEHLLTGDIAFPEQSYTLGDVIYTLDDIIYQDGMLYGTVTMRPAEGSNVILMASDHFVGEPAGYILHVGDKETVPQDAPTYLELAEAQGAKIIMPICNPQGYVTKDGTLSSSEVGIITVPQTDGSIRVTFGFEGFSEKVQRSNSYTLQFRLANWEVDKTGTHLREDSENTYIGTDWNVTVVPEMKGELK